MGSFPCGARRTKHRKPTTASLARTVTRSLGRAYARTVLRPLLHIDPRAALDASGLYVAPGPGPRPQDRTIRLAVVGDSGALGLGVEKREQTTGALLAGTLARALDHPVQLKVCGAVGASTHGMSRCVARARKHNPQCVVIIVGGNDTLLPRPVRWAARRLGRYVEQLVIQGASVVVATAPDTGSCPLFPGPVRRLLSWRSRRMGEFQALHAVRSGARVVSLSDTVFRERPDEMLGRDGFHPSAAGYALQCARLGLAVVAAAGGPAPEEEPFGPEDGELPLRDAARTAARTRDAHLAPSPSPEHALLCVRPPEARRRGARGHASRGGPGGRSGPGTPGPVTAVCGGPLTGTGRTPRARYAGHAHDPYGPGRYAPVRRGGHLR
ncbi:GDSL-type esterase/lipase family protein [Streptomyces daliensis]